MKANSMDINGLLKTAIGQLHGIQKMVEDDRYCIDISNQLLAVQSILKKTNLMILEEHMKVCVTLAMGTPDAQQKINEIMLVMKTMAK